MPNIANKVLWEAEICYLPPRFYQNAREPLFLEMQHQKMKNHPFKNAASKNEKPVLVKGSAGGGTAVI